MFALHAGWRHLLFANWPVAPETVEKRTPDALGVNTYDGTAWLSVVPYANVDVRPRRLPRGTGFRLPELNLRTYVTPREESDEIRANTLFRANGFDHPEGDPVCYYSPGLDVWRPEVGDSKPVVRDPRPPPAT